MEDCDTPLTATTPNPPRQARRTSGLTEKTRAERLPNMYGHILGRGADFPEMRRIVEPPMHVDSVLSSNIQFADWVAACVTRALEYQLIKESPYRWVAGTSKLHAVRGTFTHDSKVHLWQRGVPDLNHSDIFRGVRPLHPKPSGQLLGDRVDPSTFRKTKAAAEKAAARAAAKPGQRARNLN